jgi:hypothetical protein
MARLELAARGGHPNHTQNVLTISGLLSQVLDLDDYNLRIAAIQLRN